MKKKPTIILLAVVLVVTLFLTACKTDDNCCNPVPGNGTSTGDTTNDPVSETTDAPASQIPNNNAVTSSGANETQNTSQETSEPASKKGSTGILGNFEATDINGNPADQSIFQGKKLTMVNIWATFCGPCIREMPDLGKINKEYADKGFQIVGIPVDVTDRYGKISSEMVDTAKEIVSKTGADYLHILPSASLTKAKLGQVSSVPETIFVDENGNQVGESYVGSRSKEKWEKIIDQLLEQVK